MSNSALTALVLAALDDSAIKTLEQRVNEIAEAGFKPEIVDSLPASGNEHTLYLVPNDNDGYDEYLYINNSWEQIGDTNIDFSEYYTKTEIDNMIDDTLKQYDTMPEATAANEGQIVQYIGDTNQYYNNSYFYISTEDPDNPGEYIWEQTNVQDETDLSNYYTKTEVDQLSVTFKPYPNGFNTTGTTQQFLQSIRSLNLPAGSAYLGTISTSDMPDVVWSNAEVEVYVYPRNVIYCVMRSADASPYQWECNSYEYRGWEAIDKTAKDYVDANFLSKTNTTSYTPSGNYNPATKKYVDDSISNLNLSNYYTKTEVDNLIAQQETMPEPTSENVGQIIQYVGDTNEYYTQAYYYICVEEAGSGIPVYHWEQINVQNELTAGDHIDITNNVISVEFPHQFYQGEEEEWNTFTVAQKRNILFAAVFDNDFVLTPEDEADLTSSLGGSHQIDNDMGLDEALAAVLDIAGEGN